MTRIEVAKSEGVEMIFPEKRVYFLKTLQAYSSLLIIFLNFLKFFLFFCYSFLKLSASMKLSLQYLRNALTNLS